MTRSAARARRRSSGSLVAGRGMVAGLEEYFVTIDGQDFLLTHDQYFDLRPLDDEGRRAKLAEMRPPPPHLSRHGSDLERLRNANGRLLKFLHSLAVLNDDEAVEIMEYVDTHWVPR